MYKYMEYIVHGSKVWLFCKKFHKLCSKVTEITEYLTKIV